MATDLDKVTAAFRALATIALPDGFLVELELAVVNAHLEATRAQRAAHLLATRGPDEAAVLLNCCKSQVYALAARAKKVQKMDDPRTKAA